jgi:hypothetical protein
MLRVSVSSSDLMFELDPQPSQPLQFRAVRQLNAKQMYSPSSYSAKDVLGVNGYYRAD